MPSTHPARRSTVSVDFDGVLHSYENGWHDGTVYGTVDTTLLTKLREAGHCLAISTCRDIDQVGRAIRDRGFTVQLDHDRRFTFWSNPEVILVTNMKIAASAYIDDRAIHYHMDGGKTDSFRMEDVVDYLVPRLVERRDGFKDHV